MTRIECLLELSRITNEQTKALIYEDVEMMKGLVEEKQKILEIINQYNETYGKTFTEAEKEILVQIQEIDQKNNKEFISQLEFAKQEVRKANLLSQREQYYGNTYSVSMEGGLFFDRK